MARTRSKPAPGTLVFLVRHGQTSTTGTMLPGRANGLHLADKGREQATAVAERLSPFKDKVAAVYASPLERTRETASPIAKQLGLRVRTSRGLLECDFGDWTGKELKALMKLPEWKQVQRYPSGFRFPGGESFVDMQTRMVDTVSRLVDAHRGKVVVAVSHADPIKAVIAHAVGTHLDLFQRIVVSPCSVTAIAFGADSPVVLCVNSTGRDLTTLAPS